jgi:hypothetical protein
LIEGSPAWGKLNSVMRVEHQEAQTAFLEQLETLLTVCANFDDDQLLAASRCRGWSVEDVLVHVHLGLQDLLLGVVACRCRSGY